MGFLKKSIEVVGLVLTLEGGEVTVEIILWGSVQIISLKKNLIAIIGGQTISCARPH